MKKLLSSDHYDILPILLSLDSVSEAILEKPESSLSISPASKLSIKFKIESYLNP